MKRTALVAWIALSLAACANFPGSTSSARPIPTAEAENLQNTFDAKLLGLTVELDRLSKRVARMERTLSRLAPPEEEPMVAAPPPEIDRPAPPAVEPEAAATVPPVERPPPERPAPPVSEPPPPVEPPAPEKPADPKTPDPAAPKPGIQWTGILLDARGLADRIPPGRSYLTWIVLGPDGSELFGSEDVNAEVRRRKPIFWQAVSEAVLGEDELPLGATALRTIPTAGEVVEVDGVPIAHLTVDAETAKKITEFRGLKATVEAGDVIILILAP